MNKPSCFSLTTDNHVAHLVLSRPEAMNTMHPTFWRELHDILMQLHAEGTARALVVSSTGKHFSAGMDLQTFGGAIAMDDASAEGRAAIFDLLTDMQHTFTLIEQLRFPVIFAIQGGCIGGAVDMVTAGCLRYCTADAFFCVQEINIGMVADVGTLQRLPKLLPMALVKELAYTGRRLSADQALAHGLVNAVLPTHEACVAEAMKAAEEIARKPPVAIWGTKQVLHYARDHSTEDGLRQMGWMQGAIWSNANVREAIAATKDKREPQFPPLAPLKGFREFG
ncbi:MAG: enoyl-CoA hydratase-related protein [Limnohabitans sp.]